MSPFYDPMIAKLVVHGTDRTTALTALSTALEQTEIAGSVVNTPFLAALASDDDFAAGNVETGLIARKQYQLTQQPEPTAAMVATAVLTATDRIVEPDAADPWAALSGYAHFHAPQKTVMLSRGEDMIVARLAVAANGNTNVSFGADGPVVAPARLNSARWPGHVTVFSGAVNHTFVVADPFAAAEAAIAGGGGLRAPMPGLVKLVRVGPGESVVKGQALLVLEAMKMEHTITAPHDGVIEDIAEAGAQVTDGTVLARFVEQASAS